MIETLLQTYDDLGEIPLRFPESGRALGNQNTPNYSLISIDDKEPFCQASLREIS